MQIKTPDLGSIHNTIEAVLYCKANGMGACLGGTANETDHSTRISTHMGLACQPDFMLSKPGLGADEALEEAVERHRPGLVVLAGFMRILGPEFVNSFLGRTLNIHPSLLPSFPGLHTHQQALATGVQWHGCTVHFVTPVLDHGPIIAQGIVPVRAGDTPDDLADRVLQVEHCIYGEVARWLADNV